MTSSGYVSKIVCTSRTMVRAFSRSRAWRSIGRSGSRLKKDGMSDAWNHNIHYHDVVLRSIPPGCRRALDVGCGEGHLARQLVSCCEEVIALDRDYGVLEQARAATVKGERVTFVQGDAMVHPFSDESFDLISSVATLHHLPLRPALQRFRDLLRRGGVLAIVGLYRMHSFPDYALAAAAVPTSW